MLKQKGTLTGTFFAGGFGGGYWTASVTITGCNTPLMFCGMDCLVSGSTDNGGGSWTFSFIGALSSTIPYACFDIGLSSPNNSGMKLYNSSNQITFDSNLPPLVIVANGTENIFTATYTNIPYIGTSGRTYYNTGAGSYHLYAGSEVFPGDYEAINNIAYISNNGSNQYGVSSVSIIGGTNDPSLNEGTQGNIPWMIADVTYI
jgi:hypothetical protein